MNKQPEKTEQTKQAFSVAFCQLYSKKPIEKITVQEITRKAGFNRCTFYQYFSDIYEVLNYVENDIFDNIEKWHNSKDKNIDTEEVMIREFVKLFDEKGTYLSALLGQYGSNRFMELLKEKMPHDSHGLTLHITERISPYLIEFHNSLTLSLIQLWQKRKKDLPLEELADLMIRLNNQGMSAFSK